MLIKVDTVSTPALRDLLILHVQAMHDNSPPGTAYTLNIDKFNDPSITLFSAWDDAGAEPVLMGCGALREIEPKHTEIKSMRTADDHLRKGVGKAIALHMLGVARARGYTQVSLETGNTTAFAAAREMYAGLGFNECGPYGGYPSNGTNMFMTMHL